MAVIVLEIIDFGDGPETVEVFLPKGTLTRTEREQAERLDEFLRKTLPKIYEDMKNENCLSGPELWKWYNLGHRLRFVGDTSLVAPEDVSRGRIWLAIRQYCPDELRPSARGQAERAKHPEREGQRRDHYYCCYEIGKYRWEDISWIRRWSDWMSLFEAPGVLRDPRILGLVGQALAEREHPLSREEFRRFLKALRKPFSTRPVYTEPSELPDERLKELVFEALHSAGLAAV